MGSPEPSPVGPAPFGPRRAVAEGLLRHPAGREVLRPAAGGAIAATAAGPVPEEDGILLLAPEGISAVARRSRSCYSDAPFDWSASMSDDEVRAALDPQQTALLGRLRPGMVVADVGCGPGGLSRVLGGMDLRLLSLDLSVATLRLARERGVPCPVEASVLDLPVPDGVCDVVVCDGVIHHTEAPLRGLDELVRILRPGGILFLRVYRAGALYPFLYKGIGGPLRLLSAIPGGGLFVDGVAFPLYALASRVLKPGRARDRRVLRGIFADYFLTPRARFFREADLRGLCAERGLTVLECSPFKNVHGLFARKG